MSGAQDRLDLPFGDWIDRSRRVAFTFAGRRFEGFAGDTVASALAANGQWILSRSFKYHRPRGILTMAGQDANTLVQLPHEPNVLADRLPISDGLNVTAQNVSGSLQSDRAAIVGLFSKFLPVGFYYKAFFRPGIAWRFWEPIIRRRAGLGKISDEAAHGYYDEVYGWHDVVVVGGGPAGMSAALEAAKAGADVLLVDENPHLGGSLTYERFDVDPTGAARTLKELTDGVAAQSAITVMTGAVCNGWFADNWLPIVRGTRLHKVRARQLVLAPGAMEQPLVFRNNDLPGVMMASAAQRLIRQYGVRPGQRAVVATANEQGYGAALDLIEAGCEVAAVLDLRESKPAGRLADAVRDKGVPVFSGWTAYEAVPARGNRHVRGVVAARVAGRGTASSERRSFECDLVCVSVGFAPTYQLLAQAGGEVSYSPDASTFAVQRVPLRLQVAGALNGSFRLHAAVAEGRRAGWAAAKTLDFDAGAEPTVPDERGEIGHSHAWPIFPHPRGKDFVDFDEDLTVADLRNAIAEGHDHIELLKRYSTVGMGPSQGRHSALNTIRIAAEATGRPIEAVGRTTARPPFTAEKFAVLAGRSFDPVRLTPMHHCHLGAGARMMPAGAWLRPAYYGAVSKHEHAIREEAIAVRRNVGLVDVSTLGKMEIRGPDAAEFLERMYTFAYAKQPVGRSRYVLMTDETGAIVDDGVACRLGEQQFYVTTTTGNADLVYREMLRRNAMWRLDVDITNVTAAYAAINLAGPRARDVLAPCAELDLAKDAFPYLAIRAGEIAGIPARLIRVGFVGELGYEIHVAAGQGEAVWDALLKAGAPFEIRPFGVEAQRLLRLEKGHIIVGQDTDGLTIPQEAAMAWAIARKKPYFIGKRAIEIQERRGITRMLVGFELVDADGPLPEECHLTLRNGEIAGRVTSIAHSPVLGTAVGLAYVTPEQSRPNTLFDIKAADGRIVQARVVAPPFYDPGNARQEM